MLINIEGYEVLEMILTEHMKRVDSGQPCNWVLLNEVAAESLKTYMNQGASGPELKTIHGMKIFRTYDINQNEFKIG